MHLGTLGRAHQSLLLKGATQVPYHRCLFARRQSGCSGSHDKTVRVWDMTGAQIAVSGPLSDITHNFPLTVGSGLTMETIFSREHIEKTLHVFEKSTGTAVHAPFEVTPVQYFQWHFRQMEARSFLAHTINHCVCGTQELIWMSMLPRTQ